MIEHIEEQEKEIDLLKNEQSEYREKLEARTGDTDMLNRLYEDGFIDIDGKPTNKFSNMQ